MLPSLCDNASLHPQTSLPRQQEISMYVKEANKSISMSTNPLTYNLNGFNSKPIDESIVSRGNTRRYLTDVVTNTETDVVILGPGSAELSCAYELTKIPNVLIAIIEQSVSPGGGA